MKGESCEASFLDPPIYGRPAYVSIGTNSTWRDAIAKEFENDIEPLARFFVRAGFSIETGSRVRLS